jgi:hypothetical protein
LPNKPIRDASAAERWQLDARSSNDAVVVTSREQPAPKFQQLHLGASVVEDWRDRKDG